MEDSGKRYSRIQVPAAKNGTKSKGRYTLLTTTLVIAALLVAWTLFSRSSDGKLDSTKFDAGSTAFTVKKAVAVLRGDSNVTGTITFTQSSTSGPVSISGVMHGLDARAQRGFHIHSLGDITSGCTSTGSHYNPLSRTHGAPSDSSSERHVGDLGNVESDSNGVAKFELVDKLVSLNGPFSVIGRAVVVHEGTDDLGKGGNEESLKTGNAGGRAACGVIGLTEY